MGFLNCVNGEVPGRDVLGWRRKFGVIIPSTNTVVEPEFHAMSVPGVTAHTGRIHIRNQHLASDEDMLGLLEQIRDEIGATVERVVTAEPDYMVMGMSAETFWDGVEGNRRFKQQIKDTSGGLDVATGAEACERALQLFGAKRIGVVTPYQPVGDENVVRFFGELGFEVAAIKGLKCPSAVSIAHVTETELRERIVTDGYSEAFVEEALKHKGAYRRPIRNYYRQEIINLETEREMIELWHYYQKQYNPDQTTRVHYCVLHESVREDVAVSELLPYQHGDYPFVEFARERFSRNLLESRGIPEILESQQFELKIQRDYRADRCSIATLPPVKVPANRGKVSLVFGPGAQIPERRPGEFGWMEPPPFDRGTIEIEQAIRSDIDQYFGRFSANVPQPLTMLHQQTLVDRWLRSSKAAMAQAFALMQQYLSDLEILRVTGAMPAPFQVSREQIQGRYDLVLEFDVRDLDAEVLGKKLDVISKLAVPLDVAGVIDRAGLVQFVMNAIDPSLAQQIVRSQEVATAQEAEDEQLAYTKIAAGTEPPLPTEGMNAQLRMQVLQGIVQANPAVQQRYSQDEIFKQMIDARMKAFSFQLQQAQNAQFGRVGAVPAQQDQPMAPAQAA